MTTNRTSLCWASDSAQRQRVYKIRRSRFVHSTRRRWTLTLAKTNRCHKTKYCGFISELAYITASIIPGSGLGPICYILNSTDLHTRYLSNKSCKFADDITLVVPAGNYYTVAQELEHVCSWAEENNLKLNKSKSREIIIYRTNVKNLTIKLPLPHENITRVKNLKILGVEFDERMNFNLHVEKKICSAANKFYPIKILKSKGLSSPSIWDVAQAKIISSLMYASPAWSGVINAESQLRLEALLKKLKRLGFLPGNFKTSGALCADIDANLFEQIIHARDDHVLGQFLPEVRDSGHNLRPRSHNLTLPKIVNSMDKKNFIIRMLYKNMY